jgi:hypothetical protein
VEFAERLPSMVSVVRTFVTDGCLIEVSVWPHQLIDIRRQTCGGASAVVRLSFV